MKQSQAEFKVVFASTESTPRMIKFAEAMGKLCNFHIYFTSRPIGRPFFWSKYRLNDCCSIEKKTWIIFGKSFNYRVYKKIVKSQPDVVILGGFFEITHFFLYLWALFKGVKVVVFSEPFWNAEFGKKRKFWQKKIIAKLFVKYLYGAIDSIWGIGVGTEKFFTEYIGVQGSKVKNITYPVDIENHLLHPLRSQKNNLVFLFPHRLVEWYNPIQCLKWFVEIEQDFKNVSLILNAHGHLRCNIEKMIINYGLTSKIKFADAIKNWDDMANIYANADVLLSTKSVSENSDWSVAEIESLASGMGVIAINNSQGLNDAINSNSSGFIIDSFDNLKAVKESVARYLNEPNLLFDHGGRNRNIARQFSTEAMARKYYELLGSI